MQTNVKFVGASHSGMHGILQGQPGLLAGLECRRTDDSFGRSTALHQFHRCVQDLKRLVADVGEMKS
jgi:hypothetical protein